MVTARSRMAKVAQPRVSERAVQEQIKALIRKVGGKVWSLGTTRRGGDYQGTMQTPGFPDLCAFVPVPAFDAEGRSLGRPPQLLFVEVKARGGRLRPEQIAFRDECGFAGINHVVGDLDAVIAWMLVRGVVTESSVPHYRLPKKEAPCATEP